MTILFSPTNLFPSILNGVDVIDATKNNEFSAQINGNTPVTQYRCKIYLNDTLSSLIYDTGIKTLSTPLYPVNYQGQNQRIKIIIPSTSGMVNGSEYKYTIEVFDNLMSVLSPEEIFVASSTPILSTNIPSLITSKFYEFIGTYNQSNGVQVKYFTWTLTNLSSGNVVNNPSEIYSQDIRFIYDGFLSDTEYKIHLLVVDQNNLVLEQESVITVTYDVEPITGYLSVTEDIIHSAVNVVWNPIIITGKPSGEYEFINNYPSLGNTSLYLPENSSVLFDKQNELELQISGNNTHVINTHIKPSSKKKVLYSASGQNNNQPFFFELFTRTHSLYLNINNTDEVLLCHQTSIEDDVTIIIKPTSIKTIITRNIGGLYPNTNLYPTTYLYPLADIVSTVEESEIFIDIPATAFFNKIEVLGTQIVNYIWITSKINPTFEQPLWNEYTSFLATFDEVLEAGNIDINLESFYGWYIYREDIETNTLSFVKFVDVNAYGVIDYFIPNKGTYRYHIYPIGETAIGLPLISNAISINRDEWTVITSLETDYNENNLNFYRAYRFFVNLNVSDISNNNQPNILTGFSSLPKIQTPNHNFLSGQLSSLIGNYESICDVDNKTSNVAFSKNMYNEIFGLSTDNRRKFLKDSIGNVFEIHISAPILQHPQEMAPDSFLSVSLSWVKVNEIHNITMTKSVNIDE